VGYSVTQVWIGSRKVGIMGLEDVFAQVQKSGQTDHGQIQAEILRLVREKNYIPSGAETEYGKALLLAYRRFCGEDIPADQGVLEIRVYGGD